MDRFDKIANEIDSAGGQRHTENCGHCQRIAQALRSVATERAAEVERLRAEVEEMRNAIVSLDASKRHLLKEHDRAAEQRDFARGELAELKDAIRRLRT